MSSTLLSRRDLSPDDRYAALMHGWIAYSPEGKISLGRSYGQTVDGRKQYYLVDEAAPLSGRVLARHLAPDDDDAAIVWANAKLAKLGR